MVGVVQLAEHRIVVPGVVGSSPITHPRKGKSSQTGRLFLFSFGRDGTRRPKMQQSSGLFLGRGRVPCFADASGMDVDAKQI